MLVPIHATTARAADQFTFHGSGWGHGVGMSQYGAFGLARKGWGYQRILKHYYRGVRIREVSAPTLRIGLVDSEDVMQLKALGGAVRLRVGSSTVGQIPDGETWTLRVVADKYVIRDKDDVNVGPPVGGPAQHLFAVYTGTGARVHIPQAGHTYNRGVVEFNIHAGMLRAIAVLSTQQYLYGLGEVPSSWPTVALRAQATAARTYALEKVTGAGQNNGTCNCGLVDTVADQNYVGYDKEGGFLGSRWVAAVDATNGDVMRSEGALIKAFYSSSSGGYTEHSENVFVEKLRYTRATCDPGDYVEENSNRVWKTGPLSAESVTSSLASSTGDIGTIKGFRKYVRGPSDRIIEVTVVGESGEEVLDGEDLRAELGLKSTRFWVNRNLNVTGAIRMRYDSVGCRPGSPRTGRRSATDGSYQRFENGTIYRSDHPRATVWLRGAVHEKYRSRREWAGTLKWPTTSTRRLRLGTCRRWRCSRTNFERGGIYSKSKPGVGLHLLSGPVFRHFVQQGGLRHFGFPVTDSVRSNGSSSAKFERGTIRCDTMGRCRG
jgi:SpoIID/LytB domain protein